MNRIFNKKHCGFTLIELLVVIAIIGVLASMVMVSLVGARTRARDTRISANMTQIRNLGEIFMATHGSYTPLSPTPNLCDSSEVVTLRTDIMDQGGRNYLCPTPTAIAYCVEVQLNNDQWWCVDSALRSRQSVGNPVCAVGVLRCE